MSGDSVRVAVRVRPFNQREKKANSACIISMKDKTTVIKNPNTGEQKRFTFDFSYWSLDGCEQDDRGVFNPTKGSNYADQRTVYQDLGRDVLSNAWEGYNAALFAYGQTGSGKSYSMIGYGANRGIVPITCDELFKAIKGNVDKTKQFQVTFSMLEIYNEHVRDLLTPGKQQPPGGLKVRQHPKSGFYVENLKTLPVESYSHVERLMEQGTVNRTTAATNMNETSSRSHMVITITFKQVYRNDCGQSTTKSSQMNLVDLAGSERAASTGATGDRLKEGSAINQSLSTLGKVISALADASSGKKKVVVPYRDSVLTRLLQSALGGNSRTIMIAALSPAAINYDETLSTLRYADRAKRIQNKAVINESSTDRMIRELKSENAKLMEQLMQMQKGGQANDSMEEIQRILAQNEREMKDLQQSWQQRLEEARQAWEQQQRATATTGGATDQGRWRQLPYLQNVNEDPQLSGVVKLAVDSGKHVIGKPGNNDVTIELKGLGIQPKHAVLENTGNATFVQACHKRARVIVNGKNIGDERTKLQHLDRVKLGSNHLYLFVGPPSSRRPEDTDSALKDKYDYDFFQTELVEEDTGLGGSLMKSMLLEEDSSEISAETQTAFQTYTDLLPKIHEANAMSDDMKKGVKFEAEIQHLASHDSLGRPRDKEVIVKVTNRRRHTVWVWSREKFINRRFMIEELYQRWTEGESVFVQRSNDPFWDPVEPVYLGSCHVWLNNLAHQLDSDDHLDVHSHHGKAEGRVHVKLTPCDKRGKKLKDDAIVFEPSELLGRRLDFLVCVSQCQQIKWVTEDDSRGVYFGFNFLNQAKVIQTEPVWHSVNPDMRFTKHLTLDKVTEDTLQYLYSHALVLEMWGLQEEDSSDTDSLDRKSIDSSTDGLMAEIDRLEALLRTKDAELSALKREQSDAHSRQQMNVKPPSTTLQKPSASVKPGSAGSTSSVSSSSSTSTSSSATAGPDAHIARSLKVFFKDVKVVQKQLKDLKEMDCDVDKAEGTGSLKKTLNVQQSRLSQLNSDLDGCVNTLKDSLVTIIRKKKQEH